MRPAAPGNPAAADRAYKQRLDYWSAYGKSFLPMDALVCIVQKGRLLAFATVVRRKVEELAQDSPMVGIVAEVEELAVLLGSQSNQQHLEDTFIVQVRSLCL
jgi:hypothetical protein